MYPLSKREPWPVQHCLSLPLLLLLNYGLHVRNSRFFQISLAKPCLHRILTTRSSVWAQGFVESCSPDLEDMSITWARTNFCSLYPVSSASETRVAKP